MEHTSVLARYLELQMRLEEATTSRDSPIATDLNSSFEMGKGSSEIYYTARGTRETPNATRHFGGYSQQPTANGAHATSQVEYQQSSWHTMVFIVLFMVVVCIALAMRELVSRWCPGCFPNHSSGQALPNSSRHNNRQVVPLDVSDEQLEHEIEAQRKKRRLWYHYYLKPYLMVLTEANFPSQANRGDLSYEKEEEPDVELGQACTNDSSVVEGEDGEGTTTTMSISFNAPVLEQEQEPKRSLNKAAVQNGSMANLDEDGNKTIILWDSHASTYRHVEASCTICFAEYEVGDTLIRSAADDPKEICGHVFHYECMLAWLEKGKKRCPVCRHWYVPGLRICEQMKSAHVRANPESFHHLYDARTMQLLDSLDDDNNEHVSSLSANRDIERADPASGGAAADGDGNWEREQHYFRWAFLRDRARDNLPIETLRSNETSNANTSHHGHQNHYHHHHGHHASIRSSTRRHSFPPARVVPSEYQASLRGWAGVSDAMELQPPDMEVQQYYAHP